MPAPALFDRYLYGLQPDVNFNRSEERFSAVILEIPASIKQRDNHHGVLFVLQERTAKDSVS